MKKTAEEILDSQSHGYDSGQYKSAIKAMQEYADQVLKACIDRKRSKIGDLERKIQNCKYPDVTVGYDIQLRIHKEDKKWLEKSFITKP
jgi:hypothetical protein